MTNEEYRAEMERTAFLGWYFAFAMGMVAGVFIHYAVVRLLS